MSDIVEIKKKDLIKAAELAGGHADVIKALAPEVFEEEKPFVALPGGIYKWGIAYYIMVQVDLHQLRLINTTTGVRLEDKTYDDGQRFRCERLTYIGHAGDILTIKDTP